MSEPVSIDPNKTTRAEAFGFWMNAPNPMVTFFKTLDVSKIIKVSHRKGLRFNMLLCWCIGMAASEIKEFYILPVGMELLKYDCIAVNTIVKNDKGEVSSCDVPFSENLSRFNIDYLRLTRQVAHSCENHDLPGSMVIGTSAIVDTEIDGAVGMNSGIFNNPFMIWAGTAGIKVCSQEERPPFQSRSSSIIPKWTVHMQDASWDLSRAA